MLGLQDPPPAWGPAVVAKAIRTMPSRTTPDSTSAQPLAPASLLWRCVRVEYLPGMGWGWGGAAHCDGLVYTGILGPTAYSTNETQHNLPLTWHFLGAQA